ncbi:response regulator transcription factor [Thermoflexus sp.]|uniref:response regulator transcription factor n=1 Tax=Thermoflexus sp. TaxID=1969742 RepID=UPI002ADE03AD|nr:response regulator transcription factor [Thermoflexus sp.]
MYGPRKIRILIADDHPVLRRGLKALIEEEQDMEVIGEAGNGLEAVQLAERLRPDVVIMDISMPELDGLEATRRIRERSPFTYVLILTVHAHERYLFPVLKAGASGYVRKTAADEELIEAIRVVARGDVFLYPSATRMLLDDYLAQVRAGYEKDSYETLSDREREILRLLAEGYTNTEIAQKLNLSVKTVETYRTRIMEKLHLRTRAELVRYALRKGLISEETA